MSQQKEYYIGLGIGLGVGLGLSLLSNYLYSSVIVNALLSRFSQSIETQKANNDTLNRARDILNG